MCYITSTTNYYFNKFYEKCGFEYVLVFRFRLHNLMCYQMQISPSLQHPQVPNAVDTIPSLNHPQVPASKTARAMAKVVPTVGTGALCTCICCISLGSALVLKPFSSSGLATALVAVMLELVALVYVACPLQKNIGIPE